MKRLVIQASSRSDGHTAKMVSHLRDQMPLDLVDLSQLKIGYFDYEFRNQQDDFPQLIKRIAKEYDLIIFATPIYWYSMSAQLKTFLDRISDCLKIDKETGRLLRGKSMALLVCGSDSSEVEGYTIPFEETAKYLGMRYLGHVHTWSDGDLVDEVHQRIIQFANLLLEVQT